MKRPRILRNLICLLAVAVTIVLSACSKDNTASWIIGKWNKVNVSDLDTAYWETWEFNSDGTLVVNYSDLNMDTTVVSLGTYTVDSYDFFSIEVGDPNFTLQNGVWQIVKRKDNYMMAVIDLTQFDGAGGGLTFHEFER